MSLAPAPSPPGADDRRSAAAARDGRMAPVHRQPGRYDVSTLEEGRRILRSPAAVQAGFKAELLEARASRGRGRPPILYMEGEEHRRHRAATARFFAPRVVASDYAELMGRISERLVAKLLRRGRARLDDLSLELSVEVASAIIGLTESGRRGMGRRLDAFFTQTPVEPPRGPLAAVAQLRGAFRMLNFFWRDVKPAIRARRRAPRADVVSHLLAEGYGDGDILVECFTYGAAGMVTTREFVTMAGWHLLDRPELRARFIAADLAGRTAILEEILRLEPVVGVIYRRPAEDASTAAGCPVPHGALAAIDVRAANLDPQAYGADAARLRVDREAPRGATTGLAFGDGAHRCPGAQVALQETAIFLAALLSRAEVRLERAPRVGWNPLITGYELRGAWLTTRPPPPPTAA